MDTAVNCVARLHDREADLPDILQRGLSQKGGAPSQEECSPSWTFLRPIDCSFLDSSRKPGMPLRTVSSRSLEELRENLCCLGGPLPCASGLLLVLACRWENTRPPPPFSFAEAGSEPGTHQGHTIRLILPSTP